MAKLSMPINTQNDPEVDVIAEDIASALARLSWLLEGRIDYDNIAKIIDGSEERPLQIPASKVQDIPLISNEINCNKFFRDEVGTYGTTGITNSFIDLVWEPLKEAVINNPVFTVIKGSDAIKLANLSNQAGIVPPSEMKIEIEIPTNYKPVTYKRLFDLLGLDFSIISDKTSTVVETDYVSDVVSYSDSNKNTSISEVTFFQDGTENSLSYLTKNNSIYFNIAVVYSGDPLGEEDFINLNVDLYILCEERI